MKKTYVKIIKPQVICSSGSIQEDTKTPSEFHGELS